MSPSTPSQAPNTDRNLLFGVLALQTDLIDAAQFAEICTVWATRKSAALGDLLVERGWISTIDRDDVERLLQRKLRKYGQNITAGLAATIDHVARQSLEAIEDAAIRHSLAELPTPSREPLCPTAPYTAGPRLDRYRLNRLHAVGGIGQVWVAHDRDLGRDVALKELRPDRGDSPDYIERFVREARITGQLEHPGIVPIYELGQRQGSGTPFYIMRFLNGLTLSRSIQAYHERRAAGTARAVEFRALLQAFVGVCNAVAYAHSRGVLHRDLKGQNVVLGDFGEVVLLDWGLAKVIGDSEVRSGAPAHPDAVAAPAETQPGQVLGTPGYMAPEQAAGRLDQIDQRSDTYGLAAILYEILTGRPPFTGSDRDEMLRRVLEEDPLPARKVAATTPASLEAVCLRGLARDPARRYGSAAELAHEVENWLADEPVAAFREPLTARAARWARRHKQLVTGAAALLLTAVVALAISTGLVGQQKARAEGALADSDRHYREAQEQYQRAEENLRIARHEREIATTARGRAEANFQKARLAVDLMLTRVSEDETLLAFEPRMQQVRRRLLQDSLDFYKTFLDEDSNDPAVRLETAHAYRRMANILQDLGEYAESEKAYLSARDLCQKLADEFSGEASYVQELGGICNSLGILYRATGRTQESRDAYVQALQFKKKLAEAFPRVLAHQQEVAASLQNLSQLLRELGSPEEAHAAGAESVRAWQQTIEQFGPAPETRHKLGVSLITMGQMLEDKDEKTQEDAILTQAVKLLEDLVAEAPHVPAYRQELAVGLHNRGIVRRKLGQLDEAEVDQKRGLELRRELVKDFPSSPSHRHALSISVRSWGLLQLQRGRRADAQAALEEARQLQTKLAEDHPRVSLYRQDLATTCLNLGLVMYLRGQRREAETIYHQAVALMQQLMQESPQVPDYPSQLGHLLQNLALFLVERKELAEANRFLEQAIQWQQAALEKNPRHRIYQARLRSHLGVRAAVLQVLGDHGTAAALAQTWPQLLTERWEDAYNSACVLARCVPLAMRDAKLDAAQRQELSRVYAASAVRALRAAVDRGFRDGKKLRRDKDLEPLWGRPDFRQLQTELDSAGTDRQP